METWQKEYIRENLVTLVDEIDSNAILTYLLQSGIISRVEKDQLNITGHQSGRTTQSDKLLDIIRGRTNGYQHLTKALYTARQTGPTVTLLYGVQINTVANPFRYCGIDLKLEEILPRIVQFGGQSKRLDELCKHFNKQQLTNLRDIIDVSTYKSLIGCEEVTVAKDTLPTVIPNYIKRTLTLRNRLNKSIFKGRHQDYFLIENIEPHQLTKLAQTCEIEETIRPTNRFLGHVQSKTICTSVSGDQLHALTARFVLLENEQHFDHICDKAKGENIHYIKLCDNNYFLERSSAPHVVKKYITHDEFQISEDDFLKSVSHSCPVIISDTPGMGKSVLLANLASSAKKALLSEYVIYFDMQDLVKKLKHKDCVIDDRVIESEILDIMSTNKFGYFINKQLFHKPHHKIHLFLDAFDEVNADQQDIALSVLNLLSNRKHRFKIYITSRLHQGRNLESSCAVISYGILPFQLNDQVRFLVDHWKIHYEVEDSEKTQTFAKKLLSEFTSKLSSKDREITGIPLQCRMLADVYARDVQLKSHSLQNSKIVVNTIYEMYREYFCQKFPNTKLQPGESTLLDQHFKFALNLLFPGSPKTLKFLQEYRHLHEIFSTGIIEINKSGKKQFVHRTFAEFLVSEFFGCFMYIRQAELKIPMQVFLQFCFSKVLQVVELEVPLTFYFRDNGKYRQVTLNFNGCKFLFPNLAFFFDHCTRFYAEQAQMTLFLNILKKKRSLLGPYFGTDFLIASILNNSIGLYKLGTRFPREVFSVNSNKYISSKSNISFIEFSLLLVSQFANIDLIKLHYDFMSSLLENPINDLKYEVNVYGTTLESHPILCSSQRGDYHSFEYIFNTSKPDKVLVFLILFYCLNDSNKNNTTELTTGKLQILKFLVKGSTTNYIDIKDVSLFSYENVNVELLLFLFAHGVDLLETNILGSTIAHEVASYLSADEYHKIVEWLAGNKHSIMFHLKNLMNETAIQVAIQTFDLKNETLHILHKCCNVSFNEKNENGDTELTLAIKESRSVSLIKTLVQLGADINTRDHKCHGVLCHSINSKNIEALKYFLSLGVNPNKSCGIVLFGNIWDHVLELKSDSVQFDISAIVVLLMESGADINKIVSAGDNKAFFIVQPVLNELKRSTLEPQCSSMVNAKQSFVGNASSCMCSLCLWMCCYCCFLSAQK